MKRTNGDISLQGERRDNTTPLVNEHVTETISFNSQFDLPN